MLLPKRIVNKGVIMDTRVDPRAVSRPVDTFREHA